MKNYKLKEFFIKPFRRIKNFFFCIRYPFYKVYNRWTGKFCGYDFTEYDSIPYGWRKAFGKQLSKDIKKAGLESRKRLGARVSWKKLLTFMDIKEKYGSLCLYASATDEIYAVLTKYETLSIGYCIQCGKPARYVTNGWIEYFCENCFRQHVDPECLKDELKNCRLTKKDIPEHSIYNPETEKMIPLNIKEKYGIDFEKLWDLK